MSYATFAIGLLMTAVGGLSMYYGFGIVEVERGWTEVIAGSVAFTGGVVVMALALILQALRDLRPGEAVEATAEAPVAEDGPRRPATEPRPAAAADPVPERVPPPSVMSPPAMPRPLDHQAVAAVLAPPATVSAPPDEPDRVPEAEPVMPRQLAERAPERASERDRGGHWVGVEAELGLFYEANVGQAPATAPATLEPMPVSPNGQERRLPEPRLRAVEPARAAPVPSGGAAVDEGGAPMSVVIGRYQTDGTAYTMYADGSIEVEAPDGDYKFASMAELKAFIEAKV